jgi:hypothetical protein
VGVAARLLYSVARVARHARGMWSGVRESNSWICGCPSILFAASKPLFRAYRITEPAGDEQVMQVEAIPKQFSRAATTRAYFQEWVELGLREALRTRPGRLRRTKAVSTGSGRLSTVR